MAEISPKYQIVLGFTKMITVWLLCFPQEWQYQSQKAQGKEANKP